MSYFLAPSLVQLRNEINAAHPRRSKASDGWVGDTAHAARKSDHNPDYSAGGIVRALDVTHSGIDKAKLLRVACANPSTEYVIQDWKIYTRQNGFRAQKYTGSNGHTVHTHISIRHTAAAAAAKSWGYAAGAAPAPPAPTGTKGLTIPAVAREVIAGKWGNGDDRIRRLQAAGYSYYAVRDEVNRILSGKPTPVPKPAPKPAPGKESVAVIAAQVRAGRWGNDPDRTTKLRAAGYDPVAVQTEVRRQIAAGTATPVPKPTKSVNTIAQEVIAGDWGNDPDRSKRLQAAGHSPTAVQAEVRRLLAGAKPAATRLSVSTLAQQVINNQWGNGVDRQRRLAAAGYDYATVQAEVNRRLA